MRAIIASDIHAEFMEGIDIFMSKIAVADADTIIIAGDLCITGMFHETIAALCRIFSRVILVLGNHDFYGSSFLRVTECLSQLRESHNNLYWLDDNVIEIEGIRFVGSTLWFPDKPECHIYKRYLNDFEYIKDFERNVYIRNRRSVSFLSENIRHGDIVITHHLPSPRSIREEYRDSPLNCYYLCDLTKLILKQRPKMWIHGHTHSSFDYTVGDTRVICNPFGYYPNHNQHFISTGWEIANSPL